jgi:hypothetical protein
VSPNTGCATDRLTERPGATRSRYRHASAWWLLDRAEEPEKPEHEQNRPHQDGDKMRQHDVRE